MAVMQRLRCSNDCGAPEIDAMVSRKTVGRPPRQKEKLFIVDKTFGKDGFPCSREVRAVCETCKAALEVVIMGAAIGGRARAVVVEGDRGKLQIELGSVAQRVGERASFHDCGDGGYSEAFKATVQGPLVAPQNSGDGLRLVEVGGVAARDDGSTFAFGIGCTHGTSNPGSKDAGNN